MAQNALGMIETKGYVAALAAADAMVKAQFAAYLGAVPGPRLPAAGRRPRPDRRGRARPGDRAAAGQHRGAPGREPGRVAGAGRPVAGAGRPVAGADPARLRPVRPGRARAVRVLLGGHPPAAQPVRERDLPGRRPGRRPDRRAAGAPDRLPPARRGGLRAGLAAGAAPGRRAGHPGGVPGAGRPGGGGHRDRAGYPADGAVRIPAAASCRGPAGPGFELLAEICARITGIPAAGPGPPGLPGSAGASTAASA